MSVRTLIVDDEPVARELLRSLLDGRVEVVGECRNGEEAVDAIQRLRPELVLLDIEMPGLDGFEVLARIPRDERPAIVFVTAYDEFAVKAFEVHALDYILKPVEEVRLRDAVDRCLRVTARNGVDRLLEQRAEPSPDGDWVVVRRGQVRVPLHWQEVAWIESAGNYVRIHARGETFLLRASLRELDARLRPHEFARVHRTALVNASHIGRIEPSGHGDFEITLRDGAQVQLSRRYRDQLERVFGPLG